MNKIVSVQKSKCILCFVCEGLAPKIFHQDAIVAVNQQEANLDPNRTLLCQYACPTQAIEITDGK